MFNIASSWCCPLSESQCIKLLGIVLKSRRNVTSNFFVGTLQGVVVHSWERYTGLGVFLKPRERLSAMLCCCRHCFFVEDGIARLWIFRMNHKGFLNALSSRSTETLNLSKETTWSSHYLITFTLVTCNVSIQNKVFIGICE